MAITQINQGPPNNQTKESNHESINQMDWAGAVLELRKWVHGGGRVLPGLVARRQAEIALMNQSI